MTYEYLQTLPLTDAQKQTVTDAGYENAPTLYMMCRRIPTAMKEVLELECLDDLEASLLAIMTPAERQAVDDALSRGRRRPDEKPH